MNRFSSFGLILLLVMTAGCSITFQSFRPDADLVEERMPKEELTTTVSMPILMPTDSGESKVEFWFSHGIVNWIKPGAPPETEDSKLTGKPDEAVTWWEFYKMGTHIGMFNGKTTTLHMRSCLQTMLLVGQTCNGVGYACYPTYWSLKAYDFQPGRYRVTGKWSSFERLTETKIRYKLELWLEREYGDGVFERAATFVEIDESAARSWPKKAG